MTSYDSVTCDGKSNKEFKLKMYDMNNGGRIISQDVELTYDKYGCLEDGDILKVYVKHAKREGFMEGHDICFNNKNIKY